MTKVQSPKDQRIKVQSRDTEVQSSKDQRIKVQSRNGEIAQSRGRFQGNLAERTFEFSAAVLNAVDLIPPGTKGWTIAKQLARSGSSVGANCCEADESLTEPEFVHRCGIARKEAKETHFWLRLAVRTSLLTCEIAAPLIQEAHELVLIFTTILRKMRKRQERNL